MLWSLQKKKGHKRKLGRALLREHQVHPNADDPRLIRLLGRLKRLRRQVFQRIT